MIFCLTFIMQNCFIHVHKDIDLEMKLTLTISYYYSRNSKILGHNMYFFVVNNAHFLLSLIFLSHCTYIYQILMNEVNL